MTNFMPADYSHAKKEPALRIIKALTMSIKSCTLLHKNKSGRVGKVKKKPPRVYFFCPLLGQKKEPLLSSIISQCLFSTEF
jgi:hypothetical protein